MTLVAIKGVPRKKFTMQSRMAYYHVPSVSIAYFSASGVRWARAYGAKVNALFQAGSLSKPVSAVGIMHLVQNGQLKLDQNVNDTLQTWKVPQNAFTAKRPVTLRELLSHTAGTTVHGFDGYQRGKPVPTLAQVLDGAKPANSPPIRVNLQPATRFRYSGGGFVIADQLVLDTVHEPFAKFMHDTVLAPFGMTDSTYKQPLPQALWTRAAVGVDRDGKPYPGKWHIYPEQTAAGLWTTATDLAKFAIRVNAALMGQDSSVISADTARQMLTPVKAGYGLGFSLEGSGRTASFGHNGSNAGFNAFLVMHRGGDGIAIMTDSDVGMPLITEIVNSVAAAYGWTEYPPIEKTLYPLSPKNYARFTGTYKGPGEMLHVIVRNGSLYMIGHTRHLLQLCPESPTRFFLLTQPIDIQFNAGPSGTIRSFSILQFNNAEAKKIK